MNEVVRLSNATSVVSFKGRDGELVIEGRVEVAKLELTEEFVSGLVALAAKTLMHRSGDSKLPEDCDTEAFSAAVLDAGSGSGGRFRVSKEDLAKAEKVLAQIEAAEKSKPGFKAQWEETNGKATKEAIAAKFTEKRRKEAEEKARVEAEELRKMMEL